MTIVKSRIFHVLRRYEFGCDMKPYARIFIVHSVVKIIVKIISISSYKRDGVGIFFHSTSIIISSYQKLINCSGVAIGHWLEHSETETSTADGYQNKGLEGFPLHYFYQLLSDGVLEAEAVEGVGLPLDGRLGPDPPGPRLLGRLLLGRGPGGIAIGRGVARVLPILCDLHLLSLLSLPEKEVFRM